MDPDTCLLNLLEALATAARVDDATLRNNAAIEARAQLADLKHWVVNQRGALPRVARDRDGNFRIGAEGPLAL